jgi:hypothetical protein
MSLLSTPYLLVKVKRFLAMAPVLLVFPLTVLLFSKPVSLSEVRPVQDKPGTSELTLLFVGDIMQHMPQVEAAWNDSLGVYIYDSCFQYVAPIFQSYDLVIANLETTLAGKPYSGYPAFSSPDALLNGLKKAGVGILGTANNHCCDRGFTGISRTVQMIDSIGFHRMGTYKNEADYLRKNPLIIHKNGFRLAFLNYTYGTNGIPVPAGTVVSLIEKEQMMRDLQASKDSLVDKIIVFIHWGEEYQRQPNNFQKETSELLFNHGADLVIGSHPHTIQPMEWHKQDSTHNEKLVVWSLGNYVSNQRKRYTDGGVMAGITLKKELGKTWIKDANYQLTWVYNPVQRGKKQYYILPVRQFEQDSSRMDKESYSAMKLFISDSRELLKNNLNITEINSLQAN